MAKIYANYTIASVWDLDQICEEHNINPLNITSKRVKWDQLTITYTDQNGQEQTIEDIEPNEYCASDEFDWKRPVSVQEEE